MKKTCDCWKIGIICLASGSKCVSIDVNIYVGRSILEVGIASQYVVYIGGYYGILWGTEGGTQGEHSTSHMLSNTIILDMFHWGVSILYIGFIHTIPWVSQYHISNTMGLSHYC